MDHDVLLGRDGLALIPVRKFQDIDVYTTVMTLQTTSPPPNAPPRVTTEIRQVIGVVEKDAEDKQHVHVRAVVASSRPAPKHVAWTEVVLENEDGSAATKGQYYMQLLKGWGSR